MLPWSPGVETGSDLRPLAKLPFFETEAWASTLLFWVPVSVVAWLATAALALVVTPARLVATAGVRLWRSFFTGPGANDKGDCSGAVARARTAATSPDSELPRATASWLLDPRHALTAPRPGAAAGDDPHCREPSAETISVNGLRTDVLVLPADGLPAGAAPAATSSRRLRSSAPAPRAGDTASLDAEPDGSSPGVGRGAVVLVVFPGNPGGAAFYRDFLKSLAMVSGQMMTIVCVSHAGHTVETATARWAITRTGEAPPESAGASSGDPMTTGWWPGEAATPLAPPSLAEQSKHKAAFLADLLASDPTLRFILAGHSIGAWVAKDVAASIPSASLVGVVGVYPTVELLGTTRRGRFGFPIFRFLAPAVATVADLLSLLPNAVLRSVAGAVLGKSASSSALDAVPSLAAGPVIRNALVMAYHEMKEVGSLNETTDAAFQAIQDRLVLFYGADDHWNAVGEPDAMRARLPRSAVVIDPHPNSHSFVLSKDECRSVAASLWGYLRALLVRSGASVESTGMDSAMDLGAADEFQREASIESMGTLMQRAGAAPSGFRAAAMPPKQSKTKKSKGGAGAIARQLKTVIDEFFRDKPEGFRVSVGEFAELDAVKALVPAGDEPPLQLIQALVRSSPLVEEAWGMLCATPRSVRVAAMRDCLNKLFRNGAQVPAALLVHGDVIPVEAVLAQAPVARLSSDPALVAEAADALSFVLSRERVAELAISAADCGAATAAERRVISIAPRELQVRWCAERLVCLSDPEGMGPASLAARSLRQVAARTEQGCIPLPVLCAAPDLKALGVAPKELIKSLKSITLPAGALPGLEVAAELAPSSLLAPVYLGDGANGTADVGVAVIAHCDSQGHRVRVPVATSLSKPQSLLLAEASVEEVDGDLVRGARGGDDELVARVVAALEFHLHPARLRFDPALLRTVAAQQGSLSTSQLASLPRVKQQLEAAGRPGEAQEALVADAALTCPALTTARQVPRTCLSEAKLALLAEELAGKPLPAMVTERPEAGSFFVAAGMPTHRRWVASPAPRERTSRDAPSPHYARDAACGAGEAGHVAASGACAAGTAGCASGSRSSGGVVDADSAASEDELALLAAAPVGRAVSNVGQDDASFVDFATQERQAAAPAGSASPTGSDASSGEAEDAGVPEEDSKLGWEASLALDAFRSALEREGSGQGAADPVVERAKLPRVATLAAATEGGTPFQSAEDQAAGRFSVMSFNLMADAYADPDDYPHCSPLALSWGWRRSLIVAEVLFRRPSILCMQEVESWSPMPSKHVVLPDPVDCEAASTPEEAASDAAAAAASEPSDGGHLPKWQVHAAKRAAHVPRWGGPLDNKHTWFEETLGMHGYGSFYARKVKSGGKPMPGHTIGNALLWRRDEFDCEATHVLSLADEAMALFKGGEAVWQRGFPQVAAVACLVHRVTGRRLLAASVHLSSDYTQPHLQAMQAVALRVGLRRLAAEHGAHAVVVSGDFNGTPSSATALAVKAARISASHARAGQEAGGGAVPGPYVVANDLAASHERVNPALPAMASAAHACMGADLPFTVASPTFTDTLDFVFYGTETCVPEAVLDGLPRTALALPHDAALGDATPVALPTEEFPSDHLPVMAVLRFASRADAAAAHRAVARAFEGRQERAGRTR
ncbi:hypothetical protein FNF31_07801 [Cafeteria roenbergensis]|uniref:Endonuclease/exonuclease/phosphatase domain-containing protein n=1 Tax=Cafeteria roenbergensis TaxID=33653 RepID=A0A5A8C0N6_CAFRO|nr:hypothetical protein FNF31_07801 [Cafeteria roenbergensis]